MTKFALDVEAPKSLILAHRGAGKTTAIVEKMKELKLKQPDARIRYVASRQVLADATREEMGADAEGIDFVELTAAAGGEWDYVFFDDPVSVRDSLEGNERPSLGMIAGCSGRHVAVVGTPWKVDSLLYRTLVDDPEWNHVVTPLPVSQGTLEIKKRVGEVAFNNQYLLLGW